jgi:hypothetical protein
MLQQFKFKKYKKIPTAAGQAARNIYRRGLRHLLSATLPPGVMSLTSWATAADIYFYKICGRLYIFQNRDKKNSGDG